MNFEYKSPKEALKNEIFFDKNINLLCYKNKNGIVKIIENIPPAPITGDDVSYDNSISGLTATTLQEAIDEILTIPSTLTIAASDETTPLVIASGVVTFRMPYAMTLTEVRASLSVAGSVSDYTGIDILEGGVSILSDKLTIDFGEKTSKTAATPAVISDPNLADDAEITVDILGITGGADEAGLKVTLIGYRA